MDFVELNADQRRETINTRQRFAAWREASERTVAYRGSMVWSKRKGREYLMRSAYDKQGRRRQKSLGLRGPDTERLAAEYARGRDEAHARVQALEPVIARQVAVNRALGLGRVPLLVARIVRSLDASGLLGAGLRVLGTSALYAFEAEAGVHLDAGLTMTEDIDLLFDARARLTVVGRANDAKVSLLRLLQRVDATFERSRQTFRAVNRDGFMVDLIEPLRQPPWHDAATRIGDDDADLVAVEIAGLEWLESAPIFEAVGIDERGAPLRLSTADPRVFAAHKHWLAQRADREPIKRRRDAAQAAAVARLVATHMPHLPFAASELRMLPLPVFQAAKPLFV